MLSHPYFDDELAMDQEREEMHQREEQELREQDFADE